MTRRCEITLYLWVGLVLAGVRIGTAADPFVEQLQQQWKATRSQVTQIVEAVPEGKYDYKPTPEVRSFRELLQHIVGENYMFMGFVVGEQHDRNQFDKLTTRSELLKALSESYDYGDKVLAGMDEPKLKETVTVFGRRQMSRFGVIVANIKDNHEHYGNLVTYLRLSGIVPPRTAARQ